MSSNSCFSEVMTDVLYRWHVADTHLSAPETAKSSAFIEVVLLFDYFKLS